MKPTVSRELYKKLMEIGDWVPSAECEKWHVLNATGSTITKKLRDLESDGWVRVDYFGPHHHAKYKAIRTQKEREEYQKGNIGAVSPIPAIREVLDEEPKYRVEIVETPQGRVAKKILI